MVDFSEREKGEGGYDRTVNVTFVFFLLFYARILKYKILDFMIENTRLFLPSFENLIILLMMMMMHPLYTELKMKYIQNCLLLRYARISGDSLASLKLFMSNLVTLIDYFYSARFI